MFCRNCGNKLNDNDVFCTKCGINLKEQIEQPNNLNYNKKNKLSKLWIIVAIGLIVLAFVVLFSGVVIGVGAGYENPDSNFDFAPFGISFSIINGINIVFNIIMLVINKRSE